MLTEFYETAFSFANKKNADMEAVLFGKEDCAPSHGYGPTLRPYHLFHFVTEGEGAFRIDRRCFQLRAGDAFLIPAERISYYEASATAPWSYAWAGFTGLRATRYVQQILSVVPEQYVIRRLDTKKYAAAIDAAAVLEGGGAENYFTAQLVLYKLFSYLAADLPQLCGEDYSPSLASRIKFYLDAKYVENLRLEELAEYFHIHPNYLSRVFREAFGVAPKQYLLELKLKKSALMLRSTDESVALIAESIGFEDQHSFSRAFKKRWGVSPTEYRSQNTLRI